MNNLERKIHDLYDCDINRSIVLEVVQLDNPGPANPGPANPGPANPGPVNVEMEVESDEYYSDSGAEDDACEFEQSEVVCKVKKLVSLDRFNYNGMDRIYCVNLAYVVVKCVDQEDRNLCHDCFCLYQHRIFTGSYEHVNLHLKTKLRLNCYKKSYLCEWELHQLILAEVCMFCNRS